MEAVLPPALKEPDWSDVELEGGIGGIVCDLQIPFHDKSAVEESVKDLKKYSLDYLVILGDLKDGYSVSPHTKKRNYKITLQEEVDWTKQYLEWLRQQFPHIPIYWKEGNHDDRILRWTRSTDSPLSTLRALLTENLYDLKNLGIQFHYPQRFYKITTDEDTIYLIHGHELLRGGGGDVPALKLYKKGGTSSICAHFHKTSEYFHRDLSGKVTRHYSIGCAMSLKPDYIRVHQWNHGHALIHNYSQNYHVENKRIFDGRIF
jgi:hypothetical protein